MKQKTIVLTGASGGIGSAIAKSLSEQGAKLILVGRRQEALDALNSQLGGSHYCLAADLSTEQGLTHLLSCCQQVDRGIDMLINCAGINRFALLADTSSEQVQQMMSVNMCSPIRVCQTLLPLLQQQEKSTIINIGSTFGSIGYPGFSVYCASKFALRGFTEALRRELADTQVDVRYFAPRATQTSLNSDQVTAMNKKLGTQIDSPEDVAAEFINFIQRTNRASYFVGWPEKLFAKVNSVFPSIVEKSISKQLHIIKQYL